MHLVGCFIRSFVGTYRLCLQYLKLFDHEDEVRYFEMSVNIYRTTCRNVPKDSHLHSHRLYNVKPQTFIRLLIQPALSPFEKQPNIKG